MSLAAICKQQTHAQKQNFDSCIIIGSAFLSYLLQLPVVMAEYIYDCIIESDRLDTNKYDHPSVNS